MIGFTLALISAIKKLITESPSDIVERKTIIESPF